MTRARGDLLRPAPGATVTNVAMDCGFSHLGRFSCDYCRHFGESPSETLRRGRATPAAVACADDRLAGAA